MNYTYSSSYLSSGASSVDPATHSAVGAMAGGFLMLTFLIFAALLIILIIANYKILKKAGYNGWEVFVPFYNLYVLCKVAGLSGGAIVAVFLLPGIGHIILSLNLARAFGKDTGFALGLILLPMIFDLILAFDKNITYQGVITAPSSPTPNANPQQ